jgi:predicted Fe-Mo cluster-binding NifX family protein
MRKIAVPVIGNKLSPHFGHCEQFELFEVENNKIISENATTSPPHEPGILPAWLAKQGATDIIASGMGNRAISLFNEQKINVFLGSEIKEPKELVQNLINDNLTTGKNFCDH